MPCWPDASLLKPAASPGNSTRQRAALSKACCRICDHVAMAGRVDFSFYLITDRHQVCEGTLPEVCSAALRAGVRAIQLREKDLPTRPLLSLARELARLASVHAARIVINDRIDLALSLSTDAEPLPAGVGPPSVPRRLLRENALIGRSSPFSLAPTLGAVAGGEC